MPRRRQPESPPCDPKPSAFDYINYCESGGASGTHATAIHNGGEEGGPRLPSAPPRNVQINIPGTVKTPNVSPSSSAVPANWHTQTTPSDLTPPHPPLN